MARKAPDRSTRTQIIQIHKILEEQVTKLDGGLCEYKDAAWSDARVADEVQAAVSSVRAVRQDLFGKLRQATTGDVQTKIDELERVITNLVRSYDTLRDKHDKLVATLTVNRIVDCRHLAVTPSIAGIVPNKNKTG